MPDVLVEKEVGLDLVIGGANYRAWLNHPSTVRLASLIRLPWYSGGVRPRTAPL